jgi:hypothetical protein
LKKNIPDTDHVFLLTDYANEYNWFSAADPSGGLNYFVNTGEWEFFLPSDRKFPIAYEVMTNIIRVMMFGTNESVLEHAHATSRGCINDLCANKKEVIYKMRTGDLCEYCHKVLHAKNIDPLILSQFFKTIDDIRSQMLFRERFKLTMQPSRVEIRGMEKKIFLTDLGNSELKLAPLERTLYLLFVKHENGLHLNEIHEHAGWISETYSRIGNPRTVAELRNSIELLINPTENSVSEKISRIKNKITATVGEELAPQYIIAGERGQPKRIVLDRNLISYN